MRAATLSDDTAVLGNNGTISISVSRLCVHQPAVMGAVCLYRSHTGRPRSSTLNVARQPGIDDVVERLIEQQTKWLTDYWS